MRTGYTDEVSIKDHILNALHRDLYREWAKVLDQPKQITDWLAGLRSLGHKLEQLHKLEQAREKAPTTKEPSKPDSRNRDKGKGRERNGNRKVTGSTPRSSNDSGKDKPRFDFIKDKSTALAGVSPDLRTRRFEGNLCTRCGASGHKWTFCQATKPVGDGAPEKKIAGAKRKRGFEDNGSKKRVAVLSAPAEPTPEPSVAAVPLSSDGVTMNIVDSGPESDADVDVY
ncbi:hypothetical protein P167DRAFT_580401 [Morchella conica CCBAS932]|uniref:Uncharacterized protein n=1 Tax=Morchella conica CCBAS932 TaxID=1392247 RepID=A0A3N4K7K6_9PEZI|nr:hypothetical protein P167DRAFT_580401 [Morchella conica CCBAS932]